MNFCLCTFPSCLLSSHCNPTTWPYTFPASFLPFYMTLDGPSLHLYPPSRNPHFISLNLFPSFHVSVRSLLWSRWHFDSHACHITQRGGGIALHVWPREQRSHWCMRVMLTQMEREVLINVQPFIWKRSFVRRVGVSLSMQGQKKRMRQSEARMKEHLITWQT